MALNQIREEEKKRLEEEEVSRKEYRELIKKRNDFIDSHFIVGGVK